MKNNDPLISVLMTSYNREKYIAKSIESIFASTYTNWELIILDDFSKDRTFEIALEYSVKDSRIKAYRNKVNLGQFRNRNEIVKYSKGEYLKYLDSDDLLYPYGLEQLVYYMEQFPEAGYGLCSIKQDDQLIYPYQLTPEQSYKAHYLQGRGIFNKAPLSSIFRRKAFTDICGFPHEAVSGDFAMWNHIACYYPVVLMPEGIVWYRAHEEQEMQKTRDNYLVEFEYLKVAEYYLKSNYCPLSEYDRLTCLKNNYKQQKKFIISKTLRNGFFAGFNLIEHYNTEAKINSAF
ncbi:glycosyltransferase family 2 protein [Pontibacter fetidus]|uniref:Glycosyltransferase family 2 protein n=1 Tax=Pontibacter fetidus TaxID=2700082 RepID=A0A6B2H9S9_9BACT|nr:glycosyltransferase family 2 protein [Pontibacter fetidus]NDK56312.1 glycosyltransferase family 2 protein [Pontibacter fetidus]